MASYILALDQGTTSSRAIVFDRAGQIAAKARFDGAMAAAGRQFLFFAPHIAVVPCIMIFIVVLAFNVLGDALRDALDPRLRN